MGGSSDPVAFESAGGPGKVIGLGTWLRLIVRDEEGTGDGAGEGLRGCVEGDGSDNVVLDLLRGREKLKEGRWRMYGEALASDFGDGDRRGRGTGWDMGETGMDTPLLDDIFRGFENVEPAFELAS